MERPSPVFPLQKHQLIVLVPCMSAISLQVNITLQLSQPCTDSGIQVAASLPPVKAALIKQQFLLYKEDKPIGEFQGYGHLFFIFRTYANGQSNEVQPVDFQQIANVPSAFSISTPYKVNLSAHSPDLFLVPCYNVILPGKVTSKSIYILYAPKTSSNSATE